MGGHPTEGLASRVAVLDPDTLAGSDAASPCGALAHLEHLVGAADHLGYPEPPSMCSSMASGDAEEAQAPVISSLSSSNPTEDN